MKKLAFHYNIALKPFKTKELKKNILLSKVFFNKITCLDGPYRELRNSSELIKMFIKMYYYLKYILNERIQNIF